MEKLGFEEFGKFGNINVLGEDRGLESLMCLSKGVNLSSVVFLGSL